MNLFGKTSCLKITVSANSKNKSYIEDSYFTSPFKIMKPFERPDNGITVFLQTASAGIMAGDRQELSFEVKEGAALELVSQSFEKIFKMEDDSEAQRTAKADIAPGGRLIYTPLPCIPFAGSNFKSHTVINLCDESSKLVYQECICAGRKAHGELFDYKKYHNLIEIYCKKELIYRDNLLLSGSDGNNYPERKHVLQSEAMFGKHSHSGSMLFFNYNLKPSDIFSFLEIEDKLLYTQENLEKQKTAPLIGVTLTKGNGIALRVLADSAEEVQDIFSKLQPLF